MRSKLLFLFTIMVMSGCGMFGTNDNSGSGNGNADSLPASTVGRYSVSPYTIGSCHGGVLVIRIKSDNQCEFSWHNISCNPSYNGSKCTMDMNTKIITLKGSFGFENSSPFVFTNDSLILNNEIVLVRDKK